MAAHTWWCDFFPDQFQAHQTTLFGWHGVGRAVGGQVRISFASGPEKSRLAIVWMAQNKGHPVPRCLSLRIWQSQTTKKVFLCECWSAICWSVLLSCLGWFVRPCFGAFLQEAGRVLFEAFAGREVLWQTLGRKLGAGWREWRPWIFTWWRRYWQHDDSFSPSEKNEDWQALWRCDSPRCSTTGRAFCPIGSTVKGTARRYPCFKHTYSTYIVVIVVGCCHCCYCCSSGPWASWSS